LQGLFSSVYLFIGGSPYAMEADAGYSHELAGTDNTIFRINANGATMTVINLSAFLFP
jgi:hypothetical protein